VGSSPGAFYIGTRNSTLNLQSHAAGGAGDVASSPASTITVAEAQLNSNIQATSSFQTNGAAILQANSVLSQTAVLTPFLGGVQADASSDIVTQAVG